MKPNAIVYTSNTGHTRQYARLLGEAIGMPAYSLREARELLTCGRPVIYMGWIHASRIKGYADAARRFTICAVCGVGLCDTGTLTDEVRAATVIPADTPLFTLQGGIDRGSLKGMNKLLIAMLTKGLAATKQPTAQDARMLELLSRDASYVSAENLAGVQQWYLEEKNK